MAPIVPEVEQIATIAVMDLETTDLPQYSNNRVGITELCIYAFDAAILKNKNNELKERKPAQLPLPPRVLHKLNLLFRAPMIVNPEAERKTGLNNYLLERESKFDENAAQGILCFLKHLVPPICLVAHYGSQFDFPIIKQAFDKLHLELPIGIRYLDSRCAFLKIDKLRAQDLFNRNFCSGEFEPKRFENPFQIYKLGKLFERVFERPSSNAHRAEADVHMLTKLLQHYGVDFLNFAEEHALPFADVVPLGGKIKRK